MTTAWVISITILLAMMAGAWWRYGPRRAIGITVLMSLLVPTWVVIDLFGFSTGCTLVATIVALGAYCVHPKAQFRTSLGPADWTIIGLMLVHLWSDTAQVGFSFGLLLRIYGEWFVPYVAGRLAVDSSEDVRGLLPFALTAIGVMSVVSLVQGLSGVDLFEAVFGRGEITRWADKLKRWGMHRAYGPMKHPNYFAMAQLLLFPWTVLAAWLSRRYRAPQWWMAWPLVAAVGIFFPLSRAAQGALVLACVFGWVLTVGSRWVVGITIGSLVAGGLALQSGVMLDVLDAWGGSLKERGGEQTVVIEGQETRVTSTNNRLLYFSLYKTAMQRAGFLGFGTEAVTGFPVNVPIGQQDLETMKRLWTVDNAFLLMDLRFGILGVTLFLAWCGSVVWTWIRLLLEEIGGVELRGYLAAMAGVAIVMPLAMMTIWMPPDFGFVYLWTGGIAAGLYAGERERRVRSKPAVQPSRSRGGTR